MDALGVLIVGTGAFLIWSAYKGKHPLDLFATQVAPSPTAPTAPTAPKAAG